MATLERLFPSRGSKGGAGDSPANQSLERTRWAPAVRLRRFGIVARRSAPDPLAVTRIAHVKAAPIIVSSLAFLSVVIAGSVISYRIGYHDPMEIFAMPFVVAFFTTPYVLAQLPSVFEVGPHPSILLAFGMGLLFGAVHQLVVLGWQFGVSRQEYADAYPWPLIAGFLVVPLCLGWATGRITLAVGAYRASRAEFKRRWR